MKFVDTSLLHEEIIKFIRGFCKIENCMKQKTYINKK